MRTEQCATKHFPPLTREMLTKPNPTKKQILICTLFLKVKFKFDCGKEIKKS